MALRLFSQIEDRLNNIRTTLSEAPHYPNIHLYIYIYISISLITLFITHKLRPRIQHYLPRIESAKKVRNGPLSNILPSPRLESNERGRERKKFSGIRVTVERRSEGGERERGRGGARRVTTAPTRESRRTKARTTRVHDHATRGAATQPPAQPPHAPLVARRKPGLSLFLSLSFSLLSRAPSTSLRADRSIVP